MKLAYWITALLLFIVIQASATYQWKKTDECFKPVEVPITRSIPDDEVEYGCYYMLFDLQANLANQQNFFHYAYKLTSENGVQDNSEISIEYNPAYQKLYLNSINVYRNGVRTDYSKKVKVKEIQREEDLDYHIYDETLTVYIILEDIRIGDIIEYSYTYDGTNPIFKDLIYRTYSYQMEYTLLEYYVRVIKPTGLKIYLKSHPSENNPEISTGKYGEEWVWHQNNVPGIKYEGYTPGWFNEFPFIELSTTDNWQEIRKWGTDIFKNDEPLCDSLKLICKNIENQYTDNADKSIAALRYIQKNIRYLGIEIGVSSHKPNAPNKVFKQGFGDCKDKSLMLVKMLNQMGITAYPVLVSTSRKESLTEYLPSPMLFNHAVVKVELDGKNYWFDPTQQNQGGNIQNNYFTPYGKALVLNGGSATLDSVDAQSPSNIEINENFDIQDLDGNASLNVTTTYYGCDADDIRYTIATSSKKQIQEDYLDFYKNSYLKIDTFGSISFSDDTVYNKVIVYENYKIQDFWKVEDSTNSNKIKASVVAFDINSKINVYQNKYSNRKTPLYLEYPLNLNHNITLKLPVKWTVKPIHEIIENDFVKFTMNTLYLNNSIFLNYNFETKTGFVPANKAPGFISDIQKIKNDMAYELTYDKAFQAKIIDSTGVNGNLIMIFTLFIGLIGFVCYILILKKEEQKAADVSYVYHEKINGWVVLPIIGLFITPLTSFSTLIKNGFFSDTIWQTITNGESILLSFTLVYELLTNSSFIILPVVLLFMAFRYDKRFPRFMVYLYVFNVVACTLDIILASLSANTIATSEYYTIARAVLAAAIWIPFFTISEKCKQIFTE